MALNMYSDSACTQQVFMAQAFAGTGAQTAFALTAFAGSQLGSVYLETQTAQTGVTFAAGVGSGFSGLTASTLIGYRVIHNGTFRGTVTANDATTVTISDLTYTQATASTATLSVYAKLTVTLDYSVAANTITTVATPSAAQTLHVIPASALTANFGGTAGSVVTKSVPFWLKADSGYVYTGLQIQSLDHSQTQAALTQTGVTFASGVGSGFSGLTAGALIGRACNHNGAFVGTVTANTTTTVTISNLSYTNATAAPAVIYTIGSAVFAIDSGSGPGSYAPVLNPSDITTTDAVKFWMQDTETVPANPMNYPNQIPYVTGFAGVA
jgi:hypothetical protein